LSPRSINLRIVRMRNIVVLVYPTGVLLKRPQQISMIMTPDFLNHWNEDMTKERERRQAYGKRTAKGNS
jgi:hypothetical protein